MITRMDMKAFDNIWDAVEPNPAEAASLKLRAKMMMDIREHIKRCNMTQVEAARLFGVTQPCISDLMRGKIQRFSMDSLTGMAATAGLRVEVRVLAAA
jgi:predicted XRE-type DNA-binding protein